MKKIFFLSLCGKPIAEKNFRPLLRAYLSHRLEKLKKKIFSAKKSIMHQKIVYTYGTNPPLIQETDIKFFQKKKSFKMNDLTLESVSRKDKKTYPLNFLLF